MGMARGAVLIITQGQPVSLSGVDCVFAQLGGGLLFSIPVFVLIFVFIVVIFDFLMRKSSQMRKVYYTGSSERSAVLSGINTSNVKMYVYVVSAMLAGIAGVLQLSRFKVGAIAAGSGAELRVIAACVIGGASLSGGEGTILGAVLGVILLNVVNNGIVLLNVSVFWQDFIAGLVLLIAVVLDHMGHKKKRSL